MEFVSCMFYLMFGVELSTKNGFMEVSAMWMT